MQKLIELVDVMIVVSAAAVLLFVASFFVQTPDYNCHERVGQTVAALASPTPDAVRSIEDREGCSLNQG